MLLAEMRACLKEVTTVMEFAKGITIYDDIINTKAAWDQLQKEMIINCFRSAGIRNFKDDTPLPSPTEASVSVADDYDLYFRGKS